MVLSEFYGIIDSIRDDLIDEVREFLRMPSISGSGEGIHETATFLRDFIIDELGGTSELRSYGGHPIVFGYLDSGSDESMIYYNMYDVQPVEPLDKWVHPPFEAAIDGDKIIARGAYNTKGALLSGLLGMRTFIKNFGKLPMNVYFVLEGEEELGSPSMPKFVEDMKEELSKASFEYFAFPTEAIRGKPRVILGNKGIMFIEIRVKTSEYDVHSSMGRGLYNPAVILSRLVSSLIDPFKGPIVDWLEEDALEPSESDLKYLNDIMEASPFEVAMELYGIKETRLSGEDLYINVYFKPNVNVDGFESGYTGPGTKTIVPSNGVLRLDFRLVPNMDPDKVFQRFIDHVREIGLDRFLEISLSDKYPWSKSDPDGKAANAAREAYRMIGLKPYTIPMLPGSAPSYLFTRVLGIESVAAGPGNGGRAHAPNEYITVDTVPGIAKYTVTLMHLYMHGK